MQMRFCVNKFYYFLAQVISIEERFINKDVHMKKMWHKMFKSTTVALHF